MKVHFVEETKSVSHNVLKAVVNFHTFCVCWYFACIYLSVRISHPLELKLLTIVS